MNSIVKTLISDLKIKDILKYLKTIIEWSYNLGWSKKSLLTRFKEIQDKRTTQMNLIVFLKNVDLKIKNIFSYM